MVTTTWKKALERRGRSQRLLSKQLGVNLAEMNMVAQGRAFLTPEKFRLACELLEMRPTDVYTPDVLELIYGHGEARPSTKLVKRDMRVRLDPDTMERVEFVADDEHLTRNQAANAIIRRAFESRRIEA